MRQTAIASIAIIAGLLWMSSSLANSEGSCEIHISGAVTLNTKAKTYTPPANASYQEKADAGRVHAFSDYWMSDAELRAQLESASRFTAKTPTELKEAVDKKMGRDPRLYIVAIGCGDTHVTVELGPASGTKYANVPFKPGRYVIGANHGEKPGEFVATLLLGTAPNGTAYHSSAPGSIDIEQFDAKGLAGKFSFKAESFDKSKKIEVSGTFKYTCDGAKCMK